MAIALGAGLLGLLLGHRLYAGRPQSATSLSAHFRGLQKLLVGKYYVDELYEAVVIKPTRVLSERVLWRLVDVRVIDGLVNFMAGLTKVFSHVFRFAQSGYVQTYVLVVVLGVIILLLRAL
jgi:NADH-quinone oxidoreductase subunit L